MKTADTWFEEYGVSHKNPTNKAIHWLCVPAILFATVGLLWAIPVPEAFGELLPGRAASLVNWGTLMMMGALVFYLRLSLTIGLGMAFIAGLSVWGNLVIAESGEGNLWKANAAIFIVAWIFQFVGHKIEGMKPSFLKDLQFLLIGPAWLLHFVYRKVGIKY